jgi:hypothetical protein
MTKLGMWAWYGSSVRVGDEHQNDTDRTDRRTPNINRGAMHRARLRRRDDQVPVELQVHVLLVPGAGQTVRATGVNCRYARGRAAGAHMWQSTSRSESS